MQSAGKIFAPDALATWRCNAGAEPVAVVVGSFDMLHPGNLRTIRIAGESAGRVLVLLLENRDYSSGQSLFHDTATRAEMAAALKQVAAVSVIRSASAGSILSAVQPFVAMYTADLPIPREIDSAVRQSAASVIETPPLAGCELQDINRAIAENRTPVRLGAGWDSHFTAGQTQPEAATLATVNGCFDILHLGHLRFLQQARTFGSNLLVLINSDESVRRYKGATRPVFPMPFRRCALLSLDAVDAVEVFEEDEPVNALARIKPAIHIKGGSYEEERVRHERDLLAGWGGKVDFCPLVEGYSTSAYIRNVLGLEKSAL